MRENQNIKVFGWVGARHPRLHLPGAQPHARQARFIVAAPSRTTAARAASQNPRSAFVRDFFGETGNTAELEVARAKPGTVFAAAFDSFPREFVEVPEEFL